jgi:predicted ribosome quality control (RQC) complex YloA/Tae2 family protein
VKGAEEIIVTDYTTNQPVTIPLDPSATPILNATSYFEKAKKTKVAREYAKERSKRVRHKLNVLEQLLSEVEQCQHKDTLREFINRHFQTLKQMGIVKEKSQEADDIPFRRFTVAGGFEVWAGKNSRTNDVLTMKYAKPNDLWFHARGAGGSHVVLRVGTGNGEVGKEAIEQAAGIAAHYSQARNAKLVPVAYTQRKYVHKPRGAAEGTVVLQREKVVMVKPQLPQQVVGQ